MNYWTKLSIEYAINAVLKKLKGVDGDLFVMPHSLLWDGVNTTQPRRSSSGVVASTPPKE